MVTRLERVWAEGLPAVNGWLSIPSSITAELVARQGYDSVVIDLQHGLMDYETALTMMQGINAGSDATVVARPPRNEPGIIMKLLDAGAWGIICPMVNSPADAEAFVRACHYAPRGFRSVGPTRAIMTFGPDYIQRANDHVITLAMIETKEAFEQAAAIAATPGLTGLYIGPADLAQSLGHKVEMDPASEEMIQAIEQIRDAAKAAGKKVGMHCMMPGYAKDMAKRGFDFITLGSDVRMLTAELESRVHSFRES